MRTRTSLTLLFLMTLTVTLFGQRVNTKPYNTEIYAGFGYEAPVESANLTDVFAHSVTVYRSLYFKGNVMVGINPIMGIDPEPIDAGRKQQMVAFNGFARYYAQLNLVKGYAQMRLGPGFYRVKYNPDSDDAAKFGTEWINYFFFNLNFGGGVDIALKNTSNWHIGLGLDYGISGHKDGTGGFFVPRITVSKYYPSKK